MSDSHISVITMEGIVAMKPFSHVVNLSDGSSCTIVRFQMAHKPEDSDNYLFFTIEVSNTDKHDPLIDFALTQLDKNDRIIVDGQLKVTQDRTHSYIKATAISK